MIGEPLPTSASPRNLPALVKDLKADALGRRGARHHDHRHLPQGAPRARPRSATPTVTINGIAKGSRHDRARHGDHAGLRRDRREDAGDRCCRRCSSRAPTAPSTASPSTATPRPATRCCWSRPARRKHPKPRSAGDPMLKDFRARAGRAADRPGRCRWCRTARAPQKLVTIDVTRCRHRARRAPHRPGHRQLAAGEDRDRRRGRQLGPHRHGRRQGRREGRPRQALASPSAASTIAAQGPASCPDYDETPVAAHMKGRDDPASPSMSASARARRGSGPAT